VSRADRFTDPTPTWMRPGPISHYHAPACRAAPRSHQYANTPPRLSQTSRPVACPTPTRTACRPRSAAPGLAGEPAGRYLAGAVGGQRSRGSRGLADSSRPVAQGREPDPRRSRAGGVPPRNRDDLAGHRGRAPPRTAFPADLHQLSPGRRDGPYPRSGGVRQAGVPVRDGP